MFIIGKKIIGRSYPYSKIKVGVMRTCLHLCLFIDDDEIKNKLFNNRFPSGLALSATFYYYRENNVYKR
jgi:hypothetical protein